MGLRKREKKLDEKKVWMLWIIGVEKGMVGDWLKNRNGVIEEMRNLEGKKRIVRLWFIEIG